MVVLRCTQKLSRRLKVAPALESVQSSTRLGDWFANLFYLGRQPLIIFVSSKTLLPVILPARNMRAVADQLRIGLGGHLQRLGVPRQAIERELFEMAQHAFAPTNSRSVLGTMNDFVGSLQFVAKYYPERPWTAESLEDELVETPCRPTGYRSPHEATLGVFGIQLSPRVM